MNTPSAPLSVLIDAEGPVGTAAAQAVTSLPLSLSRVGEGPADIAVVGAFGPRQAQAATIVIAGSDDADTLDIARRSAAAGAGIVIASEWASNPALAAAVGYARDAEAKRLESRLMWDGVASLRRALSDQVIAAEALVGALDFLYVVTWDDEAGFVCAGRSGGVRLVLSAERTDARPGGLDITLFTTDGDVTVSVPAWATAQPGRAAHTTASGRREAPSEWETGMRVALRQAIDGPEGAEDLLKTCQRRHDLIRLALREHGTRLAQGASA
jgi:hypothetical protein